MKNKTILIDDLRMWLSGLACVRRKTLSCTHMVNGRLLDAGCGTGKFLELIKKRFFEPWHLHGIDVSSEKIAAAQKRLGEDPVLKVEDATDMCCYPDNFFDVVVSVLVVHHLLPEDKLEMMREMVRVTRPEGNIIITDVGNPMGIMVGPLLWHLLWKRHAHSKNNLSCIIDGLREQCNVTIRHVQFGLFYHIVATKK